MSFVHCNVCGHLPTEEPRRYSLTNCGHVFCDDCIGRGYLKMKCGRCDAPAPQLIEINRNLPLELQSLFKDQAQADLEFCSTAENAISFQNVHRANLSKLYKDHETAEQQIVKDLKQKVAEQEQIMRKLQHEITKKKSTELTPAPSPLPPAINASSTALDVTSGNPFKTPAAGMRRGFVTSTPNVLVPADSLVRHVNATPHSASIPSLSSTYMMDTTTTNTSAGEDSDIVVLGTSSKTPIKRKASLLSRIPGYNMMMNSDPLILPRHDVIERKPSRKMPLTIADRLRMSSFKESSTFGPSHVPARSSSTHHNRPMLTAAFAPLRKSSAHKAILPKTTVPKATVQKYTVPKYSSHKSAVPKYTVPKCTAPSPLVRTSTIFTPSQMTRPQPKTGTSFTRSIDRDVFKTPLPPTKRRASPQTMPAPLKNGFNYYYAAAAKHSQH